MLQRLLNHTLSAGFSPLIRLQPEVPDGNSRYHPDWNLPQLFWCLLFQFFGFHHYMVYTFLLTKRLCSSSSLFEKEQDIAVTAIHLFPSSSWATFKRNGRIYPTGKATATLPNALIYVLNDSSFSVCSSDGDGISIKSDSYIILNFL